MTREERRLPEGFGWGTATASYQIEGAATEGGRGASIWDTFSHIDGNVVGGDTGDTACDHYHRLEQDLDLLKSIGAPFYRFAPSWPRLQPGGRGPLNPEGVAFYRRMIDGLLERGITPWVTLYHWDLPQELQDGGGWLSRETSAAFADYAALVHREFSDSVHYWTTLNEPWCSAFLGYGQGVHAPGIADHGSALAAMHHLLLGHGLAVNAMRGQNAGTEIGITLNLFPAHPLTDSEEDRNAARKIDAISNRLFLDAVFKGSYPEDYLADLQAGGLSIPVEEQDAGIISTPIDLLGINYYTRFIVRARTAEETAAKAGRRIPWPAATDVQFVRGERPVTEMKWEVYPEGLAETLHRVAKEYTSLPLWITESGSAFGDKIGPDGTVDDQNRIDYLDQHFRAALDAREAGVDLRGYFVWSLMDNFEWSFGYEKRFGLVYVDYATQQRIPKRSSEWYAAAIRSNSLPAYLSTFAETSQEAAR